MFDNFIDNDDSWLNESGPDSGIIFSSRIRLARNIRGINFASKSSSNQKKDIFSKVKLGCKKILRLNNGFFINMQDIDDLDRQFLLERHLISGDHIASGEWKGLALSKDEKISIMVNEEDHLRVQAMNAGLSLDKCWNILETVDRNLGKTIPFSFSPEFGYLTSCPTNVGTGMRASCMLHLPALILTKRINKILELLARISFATRGFFGEGTQALGDFFQISNQISLGQAEEELISNLVGVVNQVKTQELDARKFLITKYKARLEDNAWRALGILKNSRLISSKEALSHLSVLSLGLDLGIIKNTDLSRKGTKSKSIKRLFIIIQPAHLQKIEVKSLAENKRDYVRAEILRKELGG